MGKLFLFNGLSSFLLFFSCGSSYEKAEKTIDLFQEEAVLSGKQLSLKYCQSCHLYPDPSTLDKDTWYRSVLPLMGRLFGIYEELVPRSEIIEGAINKKSVIEKNIFPVKQLISDEEWNKIVEFYLSTSPESLPSIERKDTIFAPMDKFEVIVPHLEKNLLQLP
jgi:DNA-directed RNA polymerase subunit H (RpoH/RPB5)